MRVISLVPAATEWICAFGGAGDLAGRSHHDVPAGVASLPVLTEPVTEGERLRLDLDRLVSLRPDLLILPGETGAFVEVAGAGAAHGFHVLTFAPETFKQILNGALAIGKAAGRLDDAMRWIAEAERGLALLRQRLGLTRRMDERALPSVLCLESADPLRVAAPWISDVIRMAGGRPAPIPSGHPPHDFSWEDLAAADPDVLVIAIPDTTTKTPEAIEPYARHPQWPHLKAVRTGGVHPMEASLLARPGPRIYHAVEALAKVIHPSAKP